MWPPRRWARIRPYMLIRFFREDDTGPLADLLCDMSRHYNGDNASSRAVVRQILVDNILVSDSLATGLAAGGELSLGDAGEIL